MSIIQARRLQLAAYLADFVCFLILMLIPAHAYDWMAEIVDGDLPDDPLRDVRLLAATGALALAVAVSLVVIVRDERTSRRMINGALVGALVVFWGVKFWR